MNFIKKNLIVLALLVIVFLPVLSFADTVQPISQATTTIKNPINVDTIDGLIKTILEGVIKIGIPIVALAIIYSGFLFVSAQGNEKKLEDAKRALLYSVIGAAILLGSWAIAQIISETVLAL